MSDVLVVVAGEALGNEMPLAGELLLGREVEGPGRFEHDSEVSRRHARVHRDAAGALIVEDLGSTNGTFVNGTRIEAPTPIVAGDTIRLGDTELRVEHVPEREPEPEPEPVAPPAAPEVPLPPPPAPRKSEPATEPPRAPTAPAPQEATLPPAPPSEQVGGRGAPPPVAKAPTANLVFDDGRQVSIPPAGLTIGREADNTLVLDDELVSRHHAKVLVDRGRYYIADLGSLNGTALNGERLVGQSRWLRPGDSLSIGVATIRFLSGSETRVGELQTIDLDPEERIVVLDKPRIALGRDPANDVVLDSPSISRFHAEIVTAEGRVELRDLGSRNGTRLNGHLVKSGLVTAGAEVGIGPYRFVFDGARLVQRDDSGALRLEAVDVTVQIKDKVILDRASISLEPGEFVVVIGESGSGKSTMIKALAGVDRPTSGVITVNGDPVRSRLPEIGYVPQFEIVHGRLTVTESLRYSAELRLPQDADDADVDAAVTRVIEETDLAEHRDTRIDSLSGGQRKRVGVATELLNRPGLLFLDEPTTGLDPGLETRMMRLFRELAAVGERAVIVVTHATKNVDLADKLCVMGRGGEPCYFGEPKGAKTFFRVADYDGIYEALMNRPAAEWRADFERTRNAPPAAAAAAASAPPPEAQTGRRRHVVRALPQAKVLASRYLKTFVRDRKNVGILLLQVPLLAAVAALLFKKAFLPHHNATDSINLLFVLVTAAIWLGSLDSVREIIKERSIFERETAVGVRTSAYLGAKSAILFSLVALQTLLLVLIALGIKPLHEAAYSYLLLAITLIVTGCIAVAMGLTISALVKTQEQATAIMPIAMIGQLLFAGAIVTTKNMGALSYVAALVFSRWSLQTSGSIAHLHARYDLSHLNFTHFFFTIPPLAGIAILLCFLGGMLGIAWLLLRRAEPHVRE